MPYVFLAIPGSKQACPNVAACWSPALPATAISAPSKSARARPTIRLAAVTLGRIERGTPNSDSRCSSQASADRLNSDVRDALLTSVTCSPVRFQISQLSTVPKANSPRSARARAPTTRSSSHAILVAEKYGSSSRPVRAVKSGSCPCSRKCAQTPAVRRSCQTIAWAIGRPLLRSQITVVSRWFAMPSATTCCGPTPAVPSARRAQFSWLDQISFGSCSTQPGCG